MSLRMVASPRVLSINGSQANSDPIHLGGQRAIVTAEVPDDTLADIQGSMDARHWVVATSLVDGSTALATIVDGTVSEVFERFKWLRIIVDSDGTAVRNFDFTVHIYEEE